MKKSSLIWFSIEPFFCQCGEISSYQSTTIREYKWLTILKLNTVVNLTWQIAKYALIFIEASRRYHITQTTSLCATAATAVARLSHRNSVRLSVHLSVIRVDQSKAMQARITKSSWSAAWKTLVSGTVKLFHKFKGGHPKRGCKMRGGEICDIQLIWRCQSETVAPSGEWLCFTGPSAKLTKSRTDEIYGWSLCITSVRQCTAVARSCLR